MALIAVVSAASGAIGASLFAISGLYTHRIRMAYNSVLSANYPRIQGGHGID